MREVFYTIFMSSPIEVLLNTLLAEAVLKGDAQCTNKRVKLRPHTHLTDAERAVLERIRLGRKSNIKVKHLTLLRSQLLDECFKRAYIKESFFFGLRKTSKFKEEIMDSMGSFNQNIVSYIDSGDVHHLKPIIPDVESIEYPSFQTHLSSRIGMYKDMLAMQRAAVDHRFGRENPPMGK